MYIKQFTQKFTEADEAFISRINESISETEVREVIECNRSGDLKRVLLFLCEGKKGKKVVERITDNLANQNADKVFAKIVENALKDVADGKLLWDKLISGVYETRKTLESAEEEVDAPTKVRGVPQKLHDYQKQYLAVVDQLLSNLNEVIAEKPELQPSIEAMYTGFLAMSDTFCSKEFVENIVKNANK